MLTTLKHHLIENRTSLILAFILLGAFGLRVWGIGFDLPNLYQPDEDALIMPAINMLKTGDLEPSRLEYGSFQIYLLVGVFTAVYLSLARAGLIADPAQLPIFERGGYPLIYEFPQFYVAARLTSAVIGTLVVLLIFMLVRRLGNERLGLIAAAITALTPMLVVQAHFSTPDTVLTFMGLLSLYLLVRVYDNWETDNGWAYIGAAFVCGLTVSTKYNGAVLLFPLLLLPLLKTRSLDQWLSLRILGGPLTFLLGFFAGTPYALLNIPSFLNWAGYSLRLYNAPNEVPTVPSWQWHFNYLSTSREAPVFILGLIGFFISLRLWGKRGFIINAFAVIFTLAIISQTNRQARMWLPLAPIFAAWAALVVDGVINWARSRFDQGELLPAEEQAQSASFQRQNLVPTIILALVFLPLLLLSGWGVINLSAPDVRTLTGQWMSGNIPPGSAIAVDYFAPNVDPLTWPVTRNVHHFDHDLGWYQEQEIEYLVFSQAIYDPAVLTQDEIDRYQRLLNQLCPVETISGPFLSNPGFTMRVYHIPPC